MNRRAVLGSLAAAAAAWSTSGTRAAAQTSGRLRRIGYFGVTPTDYLFRSFKTGLEELGYLEGRDVELIYVRHLQGEPGSLDEVAARLIAERPEVIVSGTTPPTQALQKLTPTIPIVMVTVSDAVGSGLIETVSRPGRNITGFETNLSQVLSKQLELAKEVSPRIRRIGLVLNAETPVAGRLAQHAKTRSQELGLQAVPFPVFKPDDFDTVFDDQKSRSSIDAALILPDGMAFARRDSIARAAARHSVPAIASYREEAVAGMLAAFGPDIQDLYRRAATYVDKILKGAEPATLPVEYPSRYRLVLNLKPAAAIGLTVSPTILARADEVIE